MEAPLASPPKFPDNLSLESLEPRLVVGDVSQAILHVDYIPEEIKTMQVNDDLRPVAFENRIRQAFFHDFLFVH